MAAMILKVPPPVLARLPTQSPCEIGAVTERVPLAENANLPGHAKARHLVESVTGVAESATPADP